MEWVDETRIETPEQIDLDLELAGLGSRFTAQMIDWFWKVILTLVLGVLVIVLVALGGGGGLFDDPPRWLLAVAVVAVYLLWLGYGIYFEIRGSGQTPGKRAAGIRVIQATGAPVDFRAAGIRNLLGVADFLPVFFLLGAVLVLLTSRRQRLGDLAAGTLVIRERVEALGADPAEEMIGYASEKYAFTPAHLAALTREDRNLLREFLRRYDSMERRSRERLAIKMGATFAQKTGYPLAESFYDGDDAVEFLASLLRDLEEALRHE